MIAQLTKTERQLALGISAVVGFAGLVMAVTGGSDPLDSAHSGEEMSAAAAGDLPPIEVGLNLFDRLVAALKRAIILGRFRPGDHIKEKDIAAHYAEQGSSAGGAALP